MHNFTTADMLSHVNAKKLPAAGAPAWTLAIQQLIRYSGFRSAEALARSFDPPRMSGMSVRRIYDLTDTSVGQDAAWRDKLARLSGMLGLPVETLWRFYRGEAEELRRLEFTRPGGEEIKQYLLDQLSGTPVTPRRRKRA